MTSQERIDFAASRKKEMNCCQAVLVAFADRLGKREDELLRLGSGFGSGMGTMEGTCGALVGVGGVCLARCRGQNDDDSRAETGFRPLSLPRVHPGLTRGNLSRAWRKTFRKPPSGGFRVFLGRGTGCGGGRDRRKALPRPGSPTPKLQDSQSRKQEAAARGCKGRQNML